MWQLLSRTKKENRCERQKKIDVTKEKEEDRWLPTDEWTRRLIETLYSEQVTTGLFDILCDHFVEKGRKQQRSGRWIDVTTEVSF